MRLKDKVVIATGAAQGLGKAFCGALVKEGAKIMVVDILDCKGTIEEIEASGGVARALRTDVSSPEETQKMAEETVRTFGRVDVLVNCAAIVATLQRKPFFEIATKRKSAVIRMLLRRFTKNPPTGPFP